MGTARFLCVKDLAALQQCCRALRDEVADERVWRDVARRWRGRLGALVVDASLPGHAWSLEWLRRNSLQCAVRLRLFLPEILGYSLIQPQHHELERVFALQVPSAEELRNWKSALGRNQSHVLLVSAGGESQMISFLSPYKTYWLHSKVRAESGGREHWRAFPDTGLLSLNAKAVLDEDDSSPLLHLGSSAFQRQMELHHGNRSVGSRSREIHGGGEIPNASSFRRQWVTEPSAWAGQTRPGFKKTVPHVFFLVNSSSKSSRVVVERVAVALHRSQWNSLLDELNPSTQT